MKPRIRPTWRDYVRPEPPPPHHDETFGQKLCLAIIDKLVIAVVAGVAIFILQKNVEKREARREKARQISLIAVDQPLQIASQLATHFEKFTAYAVQVRAANEKPDSHRLTELQEDIVADMEAVVAFYDTDPVLLVARAEIRNIVATTKATILTSKTLTPDEVKSLERARLLCYQFQQRVIRNSVKTVSQHVDYAYNPIGD